MIRQLPNLLTCLRILLAISLLSLTPLSLVWLSCYFLCGLTDMLDGYIARKYQLSSTLGACLDSLADLIMVTMVSLQLLTHFPISKKLALVLGAVISLKVSTLLIGFIKFKSLAWLHTYANKLAGISIFCLVPFYFLAEQSHTYLLALLAILTIFPALEELLIVCRSDKLNVNIKSIFSRQ